MKEGDIDGLVRLLADDDARIRRIARERLGALGDDVLAFVEGRAKGAEDPRIRSAAEEFLREARRGDALRRWADLAARGALDLQEGVVLIARSEYPFVDLDPYIQTLDDYARVLRQRLAAIGSPDALADKVSAFLFKEIGFRGNREAYHDPANSYLNRVMDRKLGIPISLSAIYTLLARRIGLAIEGIGMPGHFLLGYRSGRKQVFLDAFNQGLRWSHQDCVAHLEAEGFGFQEKYLRPVTDREILQRMLENLLRIYHSREDGQRVERITRMMASLQPGEADAEQS